MDGEEKIKQQDIIVFEANISEFVDLNTRKSMKNILNVLDALSLPEDKRLKLRKVVLDSINELGISFKTVISKVGK